MDVCDYAGGWNINKGGFWKLVCDFSKFYGEKKKASNGEKDQDVDTSMAS